MNLIVKLIVFISFVFIISANIKALQNDTIKIVISNQNSIPLYKVCVKINDKNVLDRINKDFNSQIKIQSDIDHTFQLIEDGDEIIKLLVLCDLLPNEKKVLNIYRPGNSAVQKQYTQAELSVKMGGKWEERKYIAGEFENIDFLRVPGEHTDHSGFIRYEGPGWESDMVGYRFYLDWRNAIDIFGKKVDTLVLQNTGLDGFESYHKMANWGVDVLHVGESLGMGSIGYWNDSIAERVSETDSIICKIEYSGILESKIVTCYYGWQTAGGKVDLKSELSIQAKSRLTKHVLKLSGETENLCTGIVKHPEAELIFPFESQGDWTYLATYGKQTLENDLLGMVIFYRKSGLIRITEDEYSNVIVLKPSDKKITYYFGAAWEQEKNRIKSKNEFIEYLNEQKEILNSEIKIELYQ